MFGPPLCDELRGYLEVKVPSAARKKGLLINWKAWRRRWLVIRRYLVSANPCTAHSEEVAILGRRLEIKLTGDDGNVSAPCPVVVVEEWQEDALVCPTKSRSHPYAFGLFPQPGCEPVLFLSGRSAEESRRWLVSIRSLLVPPFRPNGLRISSLVHLGDELERQQHQGSSLSSSPEIYQIRSSPSKSQPISFPPLPPLPSRCRLRRRSSLESLTVPYFVMDRRRSLSDSEISSSISPDTHHHHHCRHQSVINVLDSKESQDEMLNENYDHHIYAGIGESSDCSSFSNDSRSCLSSSSSSSCSFSAGLYAYASPSANSFTSNIQEKSAENFSEKNVQILQSKAEDLTTKGGKIASSLVTAGIGLIFSTPVPLNSVPELPCLVGQNHVTEDPEDKLGTLINVQTRQYEACMDRRESVASGIYEEIEDDIQFEESSRGEDVLPILNEQTECNNDHLPPPLPPRSPSQYYAVSTDKQKDLAWFLGVHRQSSSCPASDGEDEETSRDSSPINEQHSNGLQIPKRKISEPSGPLSIHEDNQSGAFRRRRKNLESFLGVMEFSSKSKDINKCGTNMLNKSLGTLEINGGAKGLKEVTEKPQVPRTRGRTYTHSAGCKVHYPLTYFQESNRCCSMDALLTKVGSSSLGRSPKSSDSASKISLLDVGENNSLQNENAKPFQQGNQETNQDKESFTLSQICISSPTPSIENAEIKEDIPFEESICLESTQSSSALKPYEPNKNENQDKLSSSPKSPRSIAKRLQWMKPSLFKLLLREQNKQPDPPSLRDKTKQVINRSLETLGWLSLATSQFENDEGEHLTVGGSSFYRSATCTGVEMETERNKALRRGAAGIFKDDISRSKNYNSMTLGRQKSSKKNPYLTVDHTEEILNSDSNISLQLLEDSAVCPYHKSQLMISGEPIGHSLEDLERLAKQELLCEQFCVTDDSDYIPMRSIDTMDNDEKISNNLHNMKCQQQKRVSVVPEEDTYVPMGGIRSALCDSDQNMYKDNRSLGSVTLDNSENHLLCRSDSDLYMSMEGRKSTQEELAQR